MHTGHIISGAGHAALFVWALLGSFSLPEEPNVEVTDVALISPEEYAALTPAEAVSYTHLTLPTICSV